jgi:diaminohydroxyphosphoribosylaminopyrimidine deaminase / 5-amino-6-(5-phosphoribosylamino)uracil reductase
MDHALRLGARGLGRTWPNPSVGCVIVAGGRVVGRGWTAPGGRPHAEPQALAQAGTAARGATVYVTLEPCAHHGRTPPCTDALIAAAPARVVTALTDPDPRVSGRGHHLLRAAGIVVTTGVQEAAARAVNAGFLKRMTRGLPFVTLKMAASLDGRTAMASGESRWITGPEARRRVHALRMTHDAVLVGAGTARSDDPDLGVRNMGAAYQPLRMVLDPRLTHRPDSRLGRAAGGGAVWMLHTDAAPASARDAWAATGARLVEVPAGDAGADLPGTMQVLAREGITRLLCEGGAGLAAGLLRDRLVDDLTLFQGGVLIGAEGHGLLGPLGLSLLADAPRPRLVSVDRIGPDTISRWLLDDPA